MRKIYYLLCLVSFLQPSLFADPSIDTCGAPCQYYPSNCSDRCCFFFGVGAGYEKFYDLPDFQYGQALNTVLLAVVPIPFLEVKNEQADGPYVEAFAGVDFSNVGACQWLGDVSTASLSGHYFDDKNNSSFSQNVALPTILTFPFLDGTGSQNVGPGIFSGKLTRKYEFWGGALDLKTKYFCCLHQLPMSVAPFLQFGIDEFNERYKIRMHRASATPLDFSLHETITTTYYDLGVGVEFAFYPSPCLSFYLSEGVFSSYAASKFTGQTLLTTAAGVFLPSEIRENHQVWNSKAKVKAGINYIYCHWVFELIGRYEYWGYLPSVSNPLLDPDGAINHPAKISNTTTSFYSVGARVAYLF